MRLQLGIDSINIGQGRNGCDLSALEIQIVPSEDVSEKVSFQKLIMAGTKVIYFPVAGAPIRRV